MTTDAAYHEEMDVPDRTRRDARPHIGTMSDMCARFPGLRETLQERLVRVPEYRVWLQNFSPGVLAAIEEPAE